MAVIQKIREKYAKLAGGVIALSLVAFIVSEGINGSFGSVFGKDSSIAKVDGKGIDAQEYYKAVTEYQGLTELYRKGQPLKEEEMAQIRQSVLEQMIIEKLVGKQAEKLGLQISEQEIKDMFYGSAPDPAVQQFPYFADQQTGQFNPQNVKEFEKAVKKGGRNAEESEQLAKIGSQWEALKKFLVRSRLVQKYNTMIAEATYTPKFIMAADEKDAAMRADIRFVKVPYTAIEDSKVTVTDADLNNYMSKHKAQFEVDQPTRSIEYIVYDIAPDAEDTLKAMNALNKIRAEFGTTTDNEKFVNRNSDDQYSDAYVTKKTYASAYADTIFNQPAGGVFGPYYENGTYRLTKIISKTTLPDSVKWRHILISTAEKDKSTLDSNVAKARIDSISAAIAGGADFKAMVEKYTADEGTKSTGGEYNFTLAQRAGISKELGDFIFEGKPGERKVVKVANANYSGYHLVEIMSQKDMVSAVKLANVDKSLITSSRSSNAILSKANQFAGLNSNAAAFDAAAKKEALNVRMAEEIKPADFTIQGIGAARELILWVYGAKEGEVSNPIQLNNRYIVAKLSAIQEPGMRKLTPSLRAQLEGMVKGEKKAAQIAEKYKSMQSLDAIAQAAGQPVQVADSLKANQSFAQPIGYEPKVIGYAFSDQLKPNAVSPALQGRDGVFFISLVKKETLPQNPADQFAQQQQAAMESMQAKNFVTSMLSESLKKNSKVTYNAKNIR